MRPCCASRCASATTSTLRGPRTIDEFRAGHATAIPLMHPWINRLEGESYEAAGVNGSTSPALTLPRDPNGLPIHGNLFGVPFEVQLKNATARRRASRLRRAPRQGPRVPVPAHRHGRRAPASEPRPEHRDPGRAHHRPGGADLVRLASVRVPPERAPRRMGTALARVRTRRGRRTRSSRPVRARLQAAQREPIARSHLRRPLRARTRPHVLDRGRRGPQPPHADVPVRSRVSVRAAIRASRSAISSPSNR